MKKTICLAVLLMLILSAAVVLAEANDMEYTYLACMPWDYRIESLPEALSGRTDANRIILIEVPDAGVLPLLLPDGCGAPEDYAYKGIIYTVVAPSGIEGNGTWIPDFPHLLVPSRVEIVGDVVHGRLAEVGTDFVTLNPFERFSGNTTDMIERFAVTDTTMIWGTGEQQLVPGDSVIIIWAPGGEALMIYISIG